MILGCGPEHWETRLPLLDAEYSVSVSIRDQKQVLSDEGYVLICGYFKCPYCWKEGYLIGSICPGKQVLISCQTAYRDFAVFFGPQD